MLPSLDHVMHTCTDRTCRLRAPVPVGARLSTCPFCHAPLAADDAPHAAGPSVTADLVTTPARRVELIGVLDNIRSARNVGAMLRTSDATGVRRLDLLGITAPGDHAMAVKTALGAQDTVLWSRHRHGPDHVAGLQRAGWTVWALEATPDATPLPAAVAQLHEPAANATPPRIVLVVGHEVAGVDPALQAMADRIVTIAMRGTKRSLNVATAFGIATWAITTA